MKYRVLGASGVQVSQLCFGTMSFGGDADERTAAAMYRACRDAGINFFDTTDQYNKGRSEEILGEHARGASRRHVSRAIDASLKRLGTDRVEIFYLHHYDARTPLDEHMRALEDAARAGRRSTCGQQLRRGRNRSP